MQNSKLGKKTGLSISLGEIGTDEVLYTSSITCTYTYSTYL